jgi:hypothetical protein
MTLSVMRLCHYAERHCAECRDLFIGMLNVILLNVVLLSVIMLCVILLSVVKLNVIILSVTAPSIITLYPGGYAVCLCH